MQIWACTCRSSSSHARLRTSHGYLQVQAVSNILADATTVCLTAPQHVKWRCIRWTATPSSTVSEVWFN